MTSSNEIIISEIKAHFPTLLFSESYEMLTIQVDVKDFLAFFTYLFNSRTLKFQFLTDLCGQHLTENVSSHFEVVYHLHSFENNWRIRVKVKVPEAHPHLPTLVALFSCANWMERETFDFYGIIFEGHPNLRRILNVDDMAYFPMRKEYPLEDSSRLDKDDTMFGRETQYGR